MVTAWGAKRGLIFRSAERGFDGLPRTLVCWRVWRGSSFRPAPTSIPLSPFRTARLVRCRQHLEWSSSPFYRSLRPSPLRPRPLWPTSAFNPVAPTAPFWSTPPAPASPWSDGTRGSSWRAPRVEMASSPQLYPRHAMLASMSSASLGTAVGATMPPHSRRVLECTTTASPGASTPSSPQPAAPASASFSLSARCGSPPTASASTSSGRRRDGAPSRPAPLCCLPGTEAWGGMGTWRRTRVSRSSARTRISSSPTGRPVPCTGITSRGCSIASIRFRASATATTPRFWLGTS